MNHILAVSSREKMTLLTQLTHPFLSSLHAINITTSASHGTSRIWVDLPPLNTVYHLLFPDVILYHLQISCNRILYYYTTRCQCSPYCLALYLLSPPILFSLCTSCRPPVGFACLVRSCTPANVADSSLMLHLCGQRECLRLEKKYGLLIGKLADPHFPINGHRVI